MHKKKLNYKLSDWIILYQLLESGYSLNESMVFFNFYQIDDLDKFSFYDLYIKNNKGSFYNNLRFFYSLFPLHQAIKNALKLNDFKKKVVQKLIKSSIYPLFVFVVALGILLFFGISILPQLASSFNIESSLFLVIQKIPIILYSMMVVIGIFFSLIGLIYVLNKSLFYYCARNIIMLIPLFSQIHSYYFLGYYAQLYECGLSSKACIEYLMQLKSYNVFKEMIMDINIQLNQGKNFMDCIKNQKILSKECRETILIAFQTKKQTNFYSQGLILIEQKIMQMIKKITSVITFISYAVVVLVVLMMYQLMLVPLDMIQRM